MIKCIGTKRIRYRGDKMGSLYVGAKIKKNKVYKIGKLYFIQGWKTNYGNKVFYKNSEGEKIKLTQVAKTMYKEIGDFFIFGSGNILQTNDIQKAYKNQLYGKGAIRINDMSLKTKGNERVWLKFKDNHFILDKEKTRRKRGAKTD